mmetsp:Transcript_31098/g.47497  ORF Transcript_31098/g.47497 Transcript_31098/m.47497 type:complete len:81 (-) Transcript_31098:2782-3024(-)
MPKAVKVGSEWYLVSMKWIQKWQSYVGFEGEPSSEKPGKMDNSDIVLLNFPKIEKSVLLTEVGDKDVWMNYQIKPNLREG